MAAADFIMPRLPDPSQNHLQNHFFQQPSQPAAQPATAYQSQYNPQISPPNVMKRNSPPGSRKPFHTRQPRPIFMPAALRPNEFPSKEPPPEVETSEDVSSSATTCRPSPSFIHQITGLGAIGIGRLSRRSTGDSSKAVDPELDPDRFPQVTAPPTRKHWKDDLKSTMCDDPSCTRQFGYFTRRHHCRRCGNIFCDYHSSALIPLDEEAQYNPRGLLSRACDFCFNEFKLWRARTSSAASSDTSSTRPATGASASSVTTATSSNFGVASTAPTSPTITSPAMVTSTISLEAPHDSSNNPKLQADVAQSVPRDWNWSTF